MGFFGGKKAQKPHKVEGYPGGIWRMEKCVRVIVCRLFTTMSATDVNTDVELY
jgi:hypothetical protein